MASGLFPNSATFLPGCTFPVVWLQLTGSDISDFSIVSTRLGFLGRSASLSQKAETRGDLETSVTGKSAENSCRG